MQRLIKRGEVAETCGVSVRTVDRWIETGSLPAVKVGGSTRVRSTDLESFIAAAPLRSAKAEGECAK